MNKIPEALQPFLLNIEDGGVQCRNGVVYETPADMIQIGVLGFCGCGSPDDNLIFIRDALRLEDAPKPDANDEYEAHMKKLNEDRLKLFGNEKSMMFFHYWADAFGLMEHGSSIPGWITGRGGKLLDALEEIYKDEK